MKHILLVGSGLMASSVVIYLLKKNNKITIASNILADAEKIASLDKNRCDAKLLDVQNHESLCLLMKDVDIVISYIPAFLHIHVAKACLEMNKNLITSSYVTPEMKSMEPEVIKKNLIFLNECGLDPGIDHFATLHIRD